MDSIARTVSQERVKVAQEELGKIDPAHLPAVVAYISLNAHHDSGILFFKEDLAAAIIAAPGLVLGT